MNEEYRKKLEKIKHELLIMKTLNIKPNYSELLRIYNIDRRTIEKYNNRYCKENIKIIRKSKLDNLKNEIKEKLELPRITITGLYQYFSKDNKIGTYSNFYKYINKHKLKPKKNNKAHLRFETDMGKQLQFDWKEDIRMVSKHGEVFEFNILSSTYNKIGLNFEIDVLPSAFVVKLPKISLNNVTIQNNSKGDMDIIIKYIEKNG